MGSQHDTLTRLNYGYVKGVFSLANEAEEELLKLHLSEQEELSSSVMIYGSSLAGFCALQGLLSQGIIPSRIFFVTATASIECFGDDQHVEATMIGALEHLGITWYRQFEIESLQENNGTLTGVELKVNYFPC